MPVRVLLRSGTKSIAVDLNDGVYRLGRDKPADVVIPDPSVSANHAELQVQGLDWTIRDLGSTNGTFINDVQIRAAKRVLPADALRLGSVNLTLEAPAAVAAAPGKKGPRPGTVKMQQAKTAAGRVQWTSRYWIGAAEAVLFLLILFFFMQLYSSSIASKQGLVFRYRSFASQYIHVLRAPEAAVPAPVLDESLGEPILVADKNGRILHPAAAEDQPKQSPLINSTTKSVFENAKLGLFTIPQSQDASGTALLSYPVRSGGDLLGYVVARPTKAGQPQIGFILMLLLMSGMVSLLLLFFALKPAHSVIRNQLEALRLKISPLVNGFVDSLPRSGNFEEANELAEEIEKAVRTSRAAGEGKGRLRSEGTGGSDYSALIAELFSVAKMPYCFVDGDFKIVFQSKDFTAVTEFARASLGTSIFETGLTSIQAKLLVQFVSDARRDGQSEGRIQLTRGRDAANHVVTIKTFADPQTRAELTGLAFAPDPD